MWKFLLFCCVGVGLWSSRAYKLDGVAQVFEELENNEHWLTFEPFESGFTGSYGEGSTPKRTRINQGGQKRSREGFSPGVKYHPENKTLAFLPGLERTNQVLRFELEGVAPRQVCPGMVGPKEDGAYYCTSPAHGFCDRRSGACHCYDGYQGVECKECESTHVRSTDGLCVAKKLCPNDCSAAGSCDFSTGTCTCMEFRTGADCSVSVCKQNDPYCQACSSSKCLKCTQGYFVDTASGTCSSCASFDPRCSECTAEGCITCTDVLLNSVMRSGRRRQDPQLPLEEHGRQLSKHFHFGTQDPTYFDQAEVFASSPSSLSPAAVACSQQADASWSCKPKVQSHLVCGHYGTIRFASSTYAVDEAARYLQVTVERSGGGFGHVVVNYALRHVTTDDGDVSPTATYTSSTTLHFLPGVIELTFQLTIHDDAVLEPDETFELELFDAHVHDTLQPVSLGPQRVATVSILDDDFWMASPVTTIVEGNLTSVVSGEASAFVVYPRTSTGLNLTEQLGGGQHVVWARMPNGTSLSGSFVSLSDSAEFCTWGSTLQGYVCSVTVSEKARESIHFAFIRSGGLTASFFDNAFALDAMDGGHTKEEPVVKRVDQDINFVWGTGDLVRPSHLNNFVSVRWEGALMLPHDANPDTFSFQLKAKDHARFFIDGNLVIDRWSEAPAGQFSRASFHLEPGKVYGIVLDFRHLTGSAHVQLLWNLTGTFESLPADSLLSFHPMQISPLSPVIAPASVSVTESFAGGSCLRKAVAGVACPFSLSLRDLHGRCIQESSSVGVDFALQSPSSPVNDLILESPTAFQGFDRFEAAACKFEGSFLPLAAGVQLLNITSHGIPLAESPFEIVVEPGVPYGSRCNLQALWDDFGFQHIVGEEYVANVTLRDGHGNVYDTTDLSSAISFTFLQQQAPFETIRANVKYSGSAGRYYVTYQASRAGEYLVQPTVGCNMMTGSEWLDIPCESIGEGDVLVHFHHGWILPSQSFASGVGISSATSGEPARFQIHARDALGNPILSPSPDTTFHVSLVYADGFREDFGPSCTHVLNDVFDCSYIPSRATVQEERALLRVAEAGSDEVIFGGFQFSIYVSDGECAPGLSFAFGDGTEYAEAGTLRTFTVQAVDYAGNNRTSPCNPAWDIQLSPEDALVQVEYTESGQYTITYNLTVSGENLMGVLVDSVALSNSPLAIRVAPNVVSEMESIIFGDGLFTGIAGEPHSVTIQAVDQFGNNITRSNEYFEVLLFAQGQLLHSQAAPHVSDGLYDGTFPSVLAHSGEEATLVVRVAVPGGLDAKYFSSIDLDPSSLELEQIEEQINFDWRFPNNEPFIGRAQGWSASWTGLLQVPSDLNEGGIDPLIIALKLKIHGGGVRLWVGDELVFDEWPASLATEPPAITLETAFPPGALLPFRMDFVKPNSNLEAMLSLSWAMVSESTWDREPNVLKAHNLFSTIPVTAFRRWRNASVTYLETRPAVSSPRASGVVETRFADLVFISGEETMFIVEARDEFGNVQIHENDTVQLFGWHLEHHQSPLDSTDHDGVLLGFAQPASGSPGRYWVSTTPSIAGPFLVYVTLNLPVLHSDLGHPDLLAVAREFGIRGSPFYTIIKPGNVSNTTSFAFGEHVASTVAGVPSHFYIQCLDEAGNKRDSAQDVVSLQWEVEGQQAIVEIDVAYEDEGLFRVSYVATRAGRWTVFVSLDGAGVMEPVQVRVWPAQAHGSSSKLILPEPARTGSSFNLVLEARDKFGNILERGGNDFVAELEIPDGFMPSIELGVGDGYMTSAEMKRYELGSPWVDFIQDVEDFGNGTYVMKIFLPDALAGQKPRLDVYLAHGTETPELEVCSSRFPNRCTTTNAVQGLETGGLLGEYFLADDVDGSDPPALIQVDSLFDFRWPQSILREKVAIGGERVVEGYREAAKIEWSGFVKAEFTATYRFWFQGDGLDSTGELASLSVGGNLLTSGDEVQLRGGRLYRVHAVVRNVQDGASLQLRWSVDHGSNSTFALRLPGVIAVTHESKTAIASDNLSSYIGAGDSVEIEGQILRVLHYDKVKSVLHFAQFFTGASNPNAVGVRRVKESVVPYTMLFHSVAHLGGSPVILEL